jgi:hypothetical protein
MMGTTGRARIALAVAMAADTPQMEMPDASGAAHSRLNLNHLRVPAHGIRSFSFPAYSRQAFGPAFPHEAQRTGSR